MIEKVEQVQPYWIATVNPGCFDLECLGRNLRNTGCELDDIAQNILADLPRCGSAMPEELWGVDSNRYGLTGMASHDLNRWARTYDLAPCISPEVGFLLAMRPEVRASRCDCFVTMPPMVIDHKKWTLAIRCDGHGVLIRGINGQPHGHYVSFRNVHVFRKACQGV